MWFKNIRLYRFTQSFNVSVEELELALASSAFRPCGSQDQVSMGWVSPVTGRVEDGPFVHSSQGYTMICAKRQEKVLPSAVVNDALVDKVEAIEHAEGRKVGRKERQSLKDDVVMELLPRAFSRSRLDYAYIAPTLGYVVVDAASASKAEALLSALREALGSLPVVPLTSKHLPVQAMTDWLLASVAPEPFVLGDECELTDANDAGSTIRCKQQDLSAEEIKQLLHSGMVVTKLNLVWKEGVRFTLDDQLAIKRLRFDDAILEKADSVNAESQAEQFDVDFAVMTIELSALVKNLMMALGGVNTDSISVEEIVNRASKADEATTGVDEIVYP